MITMLLFFSLQAKRTCECHDVINKPCSSESVCADLSVKFCHCYTEYYSCLPTYDPIENRYKNTCQNPVVKRSLSAMSNKNNNEMEQQAFAYRLATLVLFSSTSYMAWPPVGSLLHNNNNYNNKNNSNGNCNKVLNIMLLACSQLITKYNEFYICSREFDLSRITNHYL